jgi:NitT/TauT family transport system permease protein
LILACQVAFVLLVAGIWQGLVEINVIKPLFSSTPVPVAKAFFAQFGSSTFRTALGYTVYETFAGFLLAAVTGFLSGLVLFEIPFLYEVTRPFVTLFNNLPRLVFAPIIVLYFGIGPDARIVLVFSIAYIIVLLNTLAGLQNCSPDHLLLSKALGASRTATFMKFRLPSATPTIFVGLQLALTYSVTGAIVGEMLTGGDGLGSLLASYTTTYATDKLMADILIMAVLATAISVAMRLLELRILRWKKYEFNGNTA